MGIFPKKSGSVTHTTIYGPLTTVSEKTNEPISGKRTDERTDNTPNNTPKFICLKSIKKIFKFSFSQIIKGDFES